ncbi:telomerase-binding protein EST1A-like isoform X2 [Neodiprion lecontei]|uniref:Telomerase-binding protein EST1A-like isoform X2 n=1 Tax=Neodiprion lecontei TaxID=441921 RepID=A0ABM3GCH3_NEOLC|nr:telomerase-binding protein EST1A-like isoform X2 [Neodiprion lecontei]
MANNDKGRRKWGKISQENMADSKLGKNRSTLEMRGGASRAPPQPLYRPGCGPLRKSGSSSDNFDSENNPQEKPKSSFFQGREKQHQFNSPFLAQDNPLSSRIESNSDKLTDVRLNFRNNSNEQIHASSRNNQVGGDPRKKNKKPEQPLYVPKKVKESLAGREVADRSPVLGGWDRERERERENSRDWDTHSNHSHRNENHRNRAGAHGSGGNNRSGGREEHGKRGGGSRRNRNPSDCEERWRPDSPSSGRSYGNKRDNHREIRQGSEPLIDSPNTTGDTSRTRDTRSVEPIGYPEKFQGKPPSGRRGSIKDNSMHRNLKNFDHLPPRLQRKLLDKNGLLSTQNSYIGTTSEDTQWDGSTVTYQGTSGCNNYSSAMQHSQTMQHLRPSGPLPAQENWANTIPARSRGRGRLRLDEMEAQSLMFRSVTPEQFSAPNTRPQTPNQDYMIRSYDRRGSNSTMYTSIESLSHIDSFTMPPPAPAMSPATSIPIGNRRQSPPNYQRQRRGASSPTMSQQHTYQTRRGNNSCEPSSSMQERLDHKQMPNLSPSKSEPFSPLPDMSSEHTLDWSEEVELTEKLEAEQLCRSSSMISLRDNASGVTGSQPPAEASKGRNRARKKRQGRQHTGDRSLSRDKVKQKSRERDKNQQNRDHDTYNSNQKIAGASRRYNRDHTQSNNAQRSRETSKERNFRGSNRNPDDFHRSSFLSRMPDSHTDENWRAGRKPSICDSDEGRRTPCSLTTHTRQQSPHSVPISKSPPNSVLLQNNSQPSYNNAQPPGVLFLPDTSHSPPSVTPPRQNSSQQQRTLFDPNNPNKPIIITSPGSRAALARENEAQSQSSGVPIFQSHPASPGHSFEAPQSDTMPLYVTDEFGNMRPSWYNPNSESFRSAKNPYLLLDIGRADLELQWILGSGGFPASWERLSYIRRFLQESLQMLLKTDIKFCQAENVEQHFWKILFHNMIEMLRKGIPKENSEGRDHYKKIMIDIIEEGTVYLENLLTVLETSYKFKLDTFLVSPSLPKGLGPVGLALVSAQKIFLYLGDLARYKEQANETTNYGKSRHWYVKAQQINPKNGRPYNQLAVLAYCARRKLDAVYFYMRSLMASNPFHSARESLIALFDENRKKYLHYYESTERKRKEEREWKERARMKEKEGAGGGGGGLRREIWIHPGGRRVTRTTTAAAASEARLAHSDPEELSKLTSVEVNKRFVTSYLHVHGKLITKIGMETFQEAGIQMLREFRALLQHSPLPLPGTRLLQLLALNMFAIETTQLKETQLEPGYRSEVQERALVVSLQMFSLILERAVSLLRVQLQRDEHPRLIVDEDMQVLLPAIKIWCDWMLCHSTVWNPPPSCTDYRVGPPADVWSRLATMVNLLDKLDHQTAAFTSDSEAEGLELVRLPEDSTLSGFTPLMSNPQEPVFVKKEEDMEVAQVCLRIHKILFFGQVFLCGLETPVLKLQKCETGDSEYVSVVETSTASSPSSPPEQSDSEILVESYSEGEEDLPVMRRLSSNSGASTENSLWTTAPTGEIRSLIERKEELERRQRKQERHRQRVQAILQKSTVSVEIEVKPRQLVPDTNCFIDYLPQLQAIAKATSGSQPIYTLMVPLVVLNELEGLARGGDARDCPPASRAALNPEHVARVAERSRVALAFARSKNPAVRCLTTRGTVLTSSTFTVEEDVDQGGLTRNDDRILATCLSLCRTSSKEYTSVEGQPRRLRREVVLLTEDRNLRVKALARDVPVREVLDFVQWASLG